MGIIEDLRLIGWNNILALSSVGDLVNFLQNTLAGTIQNRIPMLKVFTSTYPSWVSKAFKDLISNKKQALAAYKTVSYTNRYYNFS